MTDMSLYETHVVFLSPVPYDTVSILHGTVWKMPPYYILLLQSVAFHIHAESYFFVNEIK